MNKSNLKILCTKNNVYLLMKNKSKIVVFDIKLMDYCMICKNICLDCYKEPNCCICGKLEGLCLLCSLILIMKTGEQNEI